MYIFNTDKWRLDTFGAEKVTTEFCSGCSDNEILLKTWVFVTHGFKHTCNSQRRKPRVYLQSGYGLAQVFSHLLQSRNQNIWKRDSCRESGSLMGLAGRPKTQRPATTSDSVLPWTAGSSNHLLMLLPLIFCLRQQRVFLEGTHFAHKRAQIWNKAVWSSN